MGWDGMGEPACRAPWSPTLSSRELLPGSAGPAAPPHPRTAAARGCPLPAPGGWGRCPPGTPRPAVPATPGPGRAAAVAARCRSMCRRCPAGYGSAPGPSSAAPARLPAPHPRTPTPPPRRCGRLRRGRAGGWQHTRAGSGRPAAPAEGRVYLPRCFTGTRRRLRRARGTAEGPDWARQKGRLRMARRALPGPGSCGVRTLRSPSKEGSSQTQR